MCIWFCTVAGRAVVCVRFFVRFEREGTWSGRLVLGVRQRSEYMARPKIWLRAFPKRKLYENIGQTINELCRTWERDGLL